MNKIREAENQIIIDYAVQAKRRSDSEGDGGRRIA
jgi:hypothetical protein